MNKDKIWLKGKGKVILSCTGRIIRTVSFNEEVFPNNGILEAMKIIEDIFYSVDQTSNINEIIDLKNSEVNPQIDLWQQTYKKKRNSRNDFNKKRERLTRLSIRVITRSLSIDYMTDANKLKEGLNLIEQILISSFDNANASELDKWYTAEIMPQVKSWKHDR